MMEGMSRRGAARYFGIDPRTVAKMMSLFGAAGLSAEPDRRRGRSSDPFTGIIDQILDDDQGSIAAKQRHTAKRIFERLRDEHGYGGGYTIGEGLRAGASAATGARCSCRCGIRPGPCARRISAKRWR